MSLFRFNGIATKCPELRYELLCVELLRNSTYDINIIKHMHVAFCKCVAVFSYVLLVRKRCQLNRIPIHHNYDLSFDKHSLWVYINIFYFLEPTVTCFATNFAAGCAALILKRDRKDTQFRYSWTIRQLSTRCWSSRSPGDVDYFVKITCLPAEVCSKTSRRYRCCFYSAKPDPVSPVSISDPVVSRSASNSGIAWNMIFLENR